MKKSPNLRLQKYLAECGIASRRKAEQLIKAGKVKLNGAVVTELGVKCNPERDTVIVSGRELKLIEKGLVIFHKPRGVVTTMSDPEGRRTVADYLTKRYRSYVPVGRLDVDTSGLLALTNDGELANSLLHPRYEVPRTYLATVRGSMPGEVAARIQRGVQLDDGTVRAKIQIMGSYSDTTRISVTLSIGRNRVVRRLMSKVGFPLLDLKRVSHGPFKLGTLKVGEMRKLSESEYLQCRKKIMYSREA